MIKIYSHEGAPSTNIIGKFLLDNKEYFSKNYKFEINRIKLQDTDKVLKLCSLKSLPSVVVNGKVITGEKNIIIYFNDLLNRVDKSEMTHEEYLLETNKYSVVGDKITFNDDINDDSKKDDEYYNKKISEFEKKRKSTMRNSKKEDIMNNDETYGYEIQDHEIDIENYYQSNDFKKL